MWTDGRTNTTLIVAFRNFAKAPKNITGTERHVKSNYAEPVFLPCQFSASSHHLRQMDLVLPRVLGVDIFLIKRPFVATHTIRQTVISTAVDSWVTNIPSVKMLCPQKNCLSLYLRKNITCLSVGLLRIGQVLLSTVKLCTRSVQQMSELIK
jgi:hypothetical protein